MLKCKISRTSSTTSCHGNGRIFVSVVYRLHAECPGTIADLFTSNTPDTTAATPAPAATNTTATTTAAATTRETAAYSCQW